MQKNIGTGAKDTRLPRSFQRFFLSSSWRRNCPHSKNCLREGLRWPGLLAAAIFAVAVSSTRAEAAAGRTPGTFAVSAQGASTYTIPLFTPPGPNGLQPPIALTYNSQQGNGPLGVGWSLAGLSAIYRCNLTYAQDAAPAAVTLQAGDGYCLDGQRLRLTGGTYGVAGSTYQTEITNFTNITSTQVRSRASGIVACVSALRTNSRSNS